MICEKIHEYLKSKNVEIILNCGLDNIDDKKKIIKTSKNNYKYSKLYFCLLLKLKN